MNDNKIKSNINIIEPTPEEINILNELGNEFKKYSEMSDQDRAFLNTLVLRKQPKKILELGVCSGGASIIILNAIKNSKGAHLYSIDYNTKHYKIQDKLTGFYVDNFPELKGNWTLKTGGLALDFMDEIGGDIDFCLIDTVHSNPGEILDFLMVLPYLKKDATVVFHDTNLNARISENPQMYNRYTNNLLMSAITGEKLIPANIPYSSNYDFVNIGAIVLTESSFKNVWEIFNIMTLKWNYIPKDEELTKLTNLFKKYYGQYYSDYFSKVISFQQRAKNLSIKNKQEELTLYNIQKGIKEILQKLEQSNTKINFLQKLFSVKNESSHKVLRILGFKIKFNRKGDLK